MKIKNKFKKKILKALINVKKNQGVLYAYILRLINERIFNKS